MPTICDREISNEDIERARAVFLALRSQHYNALPSRPDAKRPNLKTFKEYWEQRVPIDLFDKNPTSNLQVVCGRRWGLMVIDLDGQEAINLWDKWCHGKPRIRTWVSRSGEHGRHWWFSVPKQGPQIRRGFLWRGDTEHAGIERLGDKSLVMSPPSIHPKTQSRYVFEPHRDIFSIAMPAPAPSWLMSVPLVSRHPDVCPEQPLPTQVTSRSGRRYEWQEVLDAIYDKIGLVASWGIKFVNRNSGRDWVECHAFDRDDSHPSAAINRTSGFYVDSGSNRRLSLFALGVERGVFTDLADAISSLGDQYVRRSS